VLNKDDTLSLTCTAYGDSNMAILWKKDGQAQDAGLFEDEAAYATATNKLVNIFTKANVAATDAGELI